MRAAPGTPSDEIAGAMNGSVAPHDTLKVLFFLRGIHFGRIHENLLRCILQRGHSLHIALAVEKRGHSARTQLFEELEATYPGFSFEQLDPRTGTWDRVAAALRHGIDYMRYLGPEYANAEPLRERARERAPILLRGLLRFPLRGDAGRWIIDRLMRWVESAIPVASSLKQLVKAQGPDVVLVSPLVGLGSLESDHVRAAELAGIPTVLPVASWDNLSNKGLLRDVPTLTIVWNDTQVSEAVTQHRLPPEQVVAVGAHSFDHWFGWTPSTTRAEFAAALDINPDRPIILYLGSSPFITGNETGFVNEWLSKLRMHPRLHDANVIMRPHPYNTLGWDDVKDEPGRTRVSPRAGAVPDDTEKRTEYFDTLYHSSAVVGVNTSALIEASILRRPVLSLVSPHFRTQDGTIHFSYIAHDGNENGVVTVGRSWEEHFDQIAGAIEAPGTYDERFERFLTQFIRPCGIDTPAAPIAVDAVERAAATPVRARRSSLLRPVLILLTPLVWLLMPLFRPRHTARVVSKAARLLLKRARQRRKRLERALKERRKARKARAKAAAKAGAARKAGGDPRRQKAAKAAKPAKAAKEPKAAKPAVAKEPKPAKAAKKVATEPEAAEPAAVALASSTEQRAQAAMLGASAIASAPTSKGRDVGMAATNGEVEEPGEVALVGARTRGGAPPARDKPAKAAKPPKAAEPNQVRALRRALMSPEEIAEDRARERAERRRRARNAASTTKPPKVKPPKPAKTAKPGAATRAAASARNAKPKSKRRPLKQRARKLAGRTSKRARRRWKLTKRSARATYNRRHRSSYATTITKVPARDEIPALLNARGLTGKGAEIGVKRAGFSDFLLRTWRGERLISIDPWLSVDWEEYVDRSNVDQDGFDENYEITKNKLAKYGPRSEIWRLMSVEAAERIEDGTLDFVYIDARHDYDSVLEDLHAWYSKLKPGGIFAGHDYVDGLFPQGDFGVKSAVDEFFAERDIMVHGTEGPSPVELFPSWIVEIPADGRNRSDPR